MSRPAYVDDSFSRRNYDVIVVGSGPGGATVARELARRGCEVLILERGDNEVITGGMRQTLRQLWFPGRGMMLADGLIPVLRGITVGGSSIYYYGTAWDPPESMLRAHGIDIGADIERAKRELRPKPLAPETMGPLALRIMESARGMGLDWKPLPKFFDPEQLDGEPMGSFGAPSFDAKWNARVFVEEAVGHGATLLTRARVHRVVTEGGGAVGVELTHWGRTFMAHAPTVVVAAGGIGSPLILRESGIEGAGYDFFYDPLVLVKGTVPDIRSQQELPMVAGVHVENEGYMLTDMMPPRWISALLSAQVGHLGGMFGYRSTLHVMVKIKDDLSGYISKHGRLRKPLTRADRDKLTRGYQLARKILHRAGARHIHKSHPVAAHPGGTVKLGELLDADLQTEIEHLYVCDASVIPEAWGIPPTLTLIGLGKRLARHLVEISAVTTREERGGEAA